MNVSHRSAPPSPSVAFFYSSNNLCPGERIAVSLLGNKNRNKDTVTPDSFLDLFPGNRTPSICLLRKCFSAPSFSLVTKR